MDIAQSYIDVLRAAHLVCLAAGMGTALYLDFISFWSIGTTRQHHDVREMERMHLWVATAFAGLWVTGITLIYVRTGFDLASFSPKLWLKIAVMIAMTVNSTLIAVFVMRMVRNSVGRSFLALPRPKLLGATQIAMISLFCWTTGLALGSSVVLKTAPWEVLLPLAVGWLAILTIGGHSAVMVRRVRFARADAAPAR